MTVDAKPSLSVGEVQCETVQQVWVVSRQDRHTLSQACPVGTHLKSFSYLHTHKDTKSTLSHAGTESRQSTSSLFPAVKLMALTNPSCLVLHEVSSCLFSVHPACDRLFQLMGPHLLWVRMLFRYWLPGSWLSPCILTEQEWKWPGWCCHIYLSFGLEDNTFIMMSLHYNLGVLSLEGTGVYQAASAALILTTLFNSCTRPSETLNQWSAPKKPANFPIRWT